jgi:hypothetical protein
MNLFSRIASLLSQRSPRPRSFRYKYLIYPFDDRWQYFSVLANDQSEADTLAMLEFNKMFIDGHTVMDIFHRA